MNAISRPQTYATAPYCVEERVRGETRWVAVRARGAESSWLTPHEAGAIGNYWVKRYGSATKPKGNRWLKCSSRSGQGTANLPGTEHPVHAYGDRLTLVTEDDWTGPPTAPAPMQPPSPADLKLPDVGNF